MGDPHVHTFDYNKNDIYVDGQLELVLTETDSPLPYLKIETETRNDSSFGIFLSTDTVR